MSFIEPTVQGKVYAPGWFLAHEECERKTYEISATGAVTVGNGKYVKMGTLYTVTSGGNTDYIGFVYEDVDVTSGNMPGSVVTKGTVYENRLPANLASAAKTALVAKGFTFVTEPTVTRPADGTEG